MPLNENIEVGLLIGLNCPRAIKPLEAIPGKEDDPYAKKTALGWGIIGPVRSSNEEDAEIKSEIACNRIVTREVQGTPKQKMCHFAFKTQVKETTPAKCEIHGAPPHISRANARPRENSGHIADA